MRFVFRGILFLAIAVFAVLWVVTALTSGDRSPWVNDWLVLFVSASMLLPFILMQTSTPTDREFTGGLPAIGVVIELRRTGTTINEQPEMDFVLSVETPDGETFRATSRRVVDLYSVTQIGPGTVLPVRYKPGRKRRTVLIEVDGSGEDLQTRMQLAAFARGEVTPSAMEMFRRGIRTTALVLDMRPTGEMREGSAVLDLKLRVTRADGSTFDIETEKVVEPIGVGDVQPGRIVNARYLPEDESEVVIETQVAGPTLDPAVSLASLSGAAEPSAEPSAGPLAEPSFGSVTDADKDPRSRMARFWQSFVGQLTAFLLFFAALFFGGSWAMMPMFQSADASPSAAVTHTEAGDVALVAYEQMGPRGMWQMMASQFALDHVSAFAVDSGDLLWDARLGSSETYDTRVIGAGEKYAYVSSADGLRILSLENGAMVAGPTDIDGLDNPMAEPWAYGFDAARGLIVAIDTGDDIYEIPLDSATAELADDETMAEWLPILGDDFRFADFADSTADTALTREDGAVSVSENGIAVLGDDGEWQTVSQEHFEAPELVIDASSREREIVANDGQVPFWMVPTLCNYVEGCTLDDLPKAVIDAVLEGGGYSTHIEGFTATGSGYVVVEDEGPDDGDESRTLVTIDLESGSVVSRLDIPFEVRGGATGSSGASIVVGDESFDWGSSSIVLIGSDGTAITVKYGRFGFFGKAL